MANCLGIYILSSKSDRIIRKTYRIEKSFATEGRVIVRERKVNTKGGQAKRICLSTLQQLFRSSWEVSESYNEMKRAFINTQSNAGFSLEARVALCIHNRHLTGTRVLGSNVHDTRQDGSKRSRQEQTNEGRQKSPIMRTSMRGMLLELKNQRAQTAKGNFIKDRNPSIYRDNVDSKFINPNRTMATLALGRTRLLEGLVLTLCQRDTLLWLLPMEEKIKYSRSKLIKKKQ